jgi:hypothetical protein
MSQTSVRPLSKFGLSGEAGLAWERAVIPTRMTGRGFWTQVWQALTSRFSWLISLFALPVIPVIPINIDIANNSVFYKGFLGRYTYDRSDTPHRGRWVAS